MRSDKAGLRGTDSIISTSLKLSKKVKWLLPGRPEVYILGKLQQRRLPNLFTPDALIELDDENLEGHLSEYIEHKLYALKVSDLGHTYMKEHLETVSTIIYQRAMDNFLRLSRVQGSQKRVRAIHSRKH